MRILHGYVVDIDFLYDMVDHNCVEFPINVLARVRAEDQLTIIL